jgi:CTP synthase (UTP-ammonia lyase)
VAGINYNECYRKDIIRDNLSVVGKDSDGNARIVGLASHPYLNGNPLSSSAFHKAGNPHPVVLAFLGAAAAFRTLKGILRIPAYGS